MTELEALIQQIREEWDKLPIPTIDPPLALFSAEYLKPRWDIIGDGDAETVFELYGGKAYDAIDCEASATSHVMFQVYMLDHVPRIYYLGTLLLCICRNLGPIDRIWVTEPLCYQLTREVYKFIDRPALEAKLTAAQKKCWLAVLDQLYHFELEIQIHRRDSSEIFDGLSDFREIAIERWGEK